MQQSYAKSPPPGTGEADVKANILIMLDKSGSMGRAQSTPDLRLPTDVAVNSAGLVHVVDWYDNAIKIFSATGKLLHTNRKRWGRNYIYAATKIVIDKYDNYWVLNRQGQELFKYNSSHNLECVYTYNMDGYTYNYMAHTMATDSKGRIFIRKYSYPHIIVVNNDCSAAGAINAQGGSTIGINNSDEIFITSYSSDSLRRITDYDNKLSSLPSSGKPQSEWLVRNTEYTLVIGDITGRPRNCSSGKVRGLLDMEFTDDGSMYGLDYYCNRMVKITGPTGMTPHKQYPQSEGGGVGYHGIWTVEATFGSRGSGNNQWDYSYGIGSRGNDLYVADSDNQRVLKYNASTNFATYDTKIGTSFSSMDMAKRVIKAIMRDSSITDGANFGLMEWSCNYKVRVNVSDTGAQEILADIDNITTGGGTCLGKAMQHAENYFKGSNSPIDPNVSCENTYIIVISDGVWVQNPNPDTVAARLLNGRDNIKTYAVGFLNYGNKSNYQSLAIAGGTKTPLYADDEDALLQKLKDTLTQVVASNQTYTAPMITSDLSKGDFIYQSLFNYKTSSQWEGHLNKYNLKADGSIGSLIWDAGARLNSKSASSRKIWTVGEGYPSGLNNFTTSNLSHLKSELYYRVTEGSDSDATKLINYVRGVDVYDEDKDGNATEERWKLGDIYHSELALISAPNATHTSSNTFTEAHYRQNNNYSGFKNANSHRSSIILAGANDGMLHAFDTLSGKELWAFIPPSLIQKLRTVVSSKANSTNPIFGVDGSPVVKDIYYKNKWRTVALTGLGKGGNSYFALDVTDVNQPAHLFTIMNDPNFKEVSYWDASGDKTVYSYNNTFFPNDVYDFSKLGEAWSTPRIMRMKIANKDKWVAVFGAGFNNAVSPEYGSAVFIIDMEDGGKIIKQIDVADKSGNSIVNSVPVGIIPIIADGSRLANYHGAMAYFADYEGKLWKLNLSDQGTLYDIQQLFDAESTSANGRRVMKDVVASIDTNNTLWFYFGTGDLQQLQKVSPSIANRLYGLKDTDFPNFNSGATAFSVNQCSDVTSKSASCPTDSEKGWYINLKDNEKTTARATVSNRTVYFSRYIPNNANPCVPGNASITSLEYRCGNVEQDISLGGGVATEAVIFNDKIYVGLSGATDSTGSSSSGTPTSGTTTLEEGWTKTGNLIVGTASADPPGSGGGQITIESWREIF